MNFIRLFRDIELGEWRVANRVTKVTYQKAFVIGSYLQEKIGIEIEVNDGNPELALQQAKSIAEKFHKDNNPQLTDGVEYNPNGRYEPPILTPIPSLDRKAIERLEILIDDAKTLGDLEWLVEEVEKYGLQNHYNNKLKQLS